MRSTALAVSFFALVLFGLVHGPALGQAPNLGGQGVLGGQGDLGGQTAEHFEKQVTKTFELDYLLAVPDDYDPNGSSVPLILFLHGAGERGDKVRKVATHGPPKLIAAGQKIPAIVVSPQCPAGEWWNDHLDGLSALLDQILDQYNVDESRIYLTGLSMGGYGSWALAAMEPERFAAVVPICGGGAKSMGRSLRDLPIWAFHGDADRVVPVQESRDMVESIERRGGKKVRLTTYPGVRHDSWTQTYDDPEVWEWLLAQTKAKPSPPGKP